MSEDFYEEEFPPLVLSEEPLTSIVFKGVREEAKRITEFLRTNHLLRKREYYRRQLSGMKLLSRIPSVDTRYCCLAVDTSFTSPPLELTGGKLLVITRSHVFYGCSDTGGLEKTSTVGYVKFIQENEVVGTPYSKIVEREFVKKILVGKKKGECSVDLILVDGELFPRIPPGYVGVKDSESSVIRAYNRVLDLTQEILELARETGTVVVGIVKRVYGRDLQVLLKDPDVRVNDKAFSTFILDNGEWINVGTYTSIADRLEEYIESFKHSLEPRLLRSLRERLKWITRVIHYSPTTSEINVAVYKACNPTYFMISTKIEAFIPGKTGLENIVGYLSRITGVNGVPHPIDIVDSMSLIKRDLLHLVQQQLYSELARVLNDNKLALSIAGLTNPEKMSRIGFR